jgi:hypothetical protein
MKSIHIMFKESNDKSGIIILKHIRTVNTLPYVLHIYNLFLE